MRHLLCAAAIVLAAPGFAQTLEPRIEVTLEPEGTLLVGQQMQLRISLLSPNYLLSTPDWPDMQIADAITRPAANTARPASRRIDGVSWTVISRVYEITPQRAADFRLPAQPLSLSYADPDTNAPVEATVEIPEIEFSSDLPAGGESLQPFVLASDIHIEDSIDGLGDTPAIGDAVTRTLTITAEGSQAMLLPQILGVTAPEGLRAYPKEPSLADAAGQRGEPPVATRIDAVTYVIEQPGDFMLPAIRLSWWNSTTASIETDTVDPVTFSVQTPPGWRPEGQTSRMAQVLPWALAALGLLAVVAWRAMPRLKQAVARRAMSEPVLFRRLRAHARAGRMIEMRAALTPWLATFGMAEAPVSLQAALLRADRMQWGRDGGQPLSASVKANIMAALASARQDLKRRPHAARSQLPPLNPW
ncbi:BatD family protein [Falsirhodobacter sp. alg1]|uniref:BatD family protein n=1 Tax=Falsirhodobacter sp. alg1 TaxID=1472418 RepID=UPI0007894653|nr:BatD family protein [Falsirhodobacter sp. alg1]